MGESDSKRLEGLIQAIADGEAVDWLAQEQAGGNEDLRRLLGDLRLISGVADVHRSAVDPSERQADAIASTGASATTRPAPSEAPTGPVETERWGHLVLIRRIGEGGFGEVFQARDPWLDHIVALKLLKPNLTDQARLLDEARTLAKIRHENVVRVHGVDVHDGRIGFWMEFVHGQTLSDVLDREGVRSASEAAGIGQELCRAIAAVHGKNIVHRDIKAKNVMRELDTGRIVLMDFGAGQRLHATTASRFLTGTPLYLAPELFDGRPATRQSDVYALGVLLFNLVTGSYPVISDSLEGMALAHQSGERTRLGDLRPDLPDAFVRAVSTMLSPDPGKRYATATATREALEATLVPSSGKSAANARSTPDVQGGLRDRVTRVTLTTAVSLLVLSFLGFVSCTLYDSPLDLTEGFSSESPLSWPIWGFRAVFAAILVMSGIAVTWALLRVLGRGILKLAPPLGRWFQRLSTWADVRRERIMASPSGTVASAILFVQIGATAVFAWVFRGLLGGLDSFISRSLPNNLAALSPGNRWEQILFEVALCVLVMVFGAVWIRLFRRRTSSDAMRYIAGGVAVTLLTFLLGKIVPFRILYHNQSERVSYQSQRCYLVGQRGNEARLFCPHRSPPWNRVVKMDDPTLKREGISENIFAGFDSGQ